ncbi:MAG: hypothetical protein ACJAYF_003690 [Arenicella sp.]
MDDIYITEVIGFGDLLRHKVNLTSTDLARNQFKTMSISQLSINTLLTPRINHFRTTAGVSSIIALCTLLLTTMTNANDYKVEVLIFENINAAKATESHAYQPPQLMKSDSQAWIIEPSMLLEEANSLEGSQDHLLKHHYSWGIESLPYQESANYTIVETESQGYIKVYADLLLFTNIDLDYKGFRLKENRRLKLDEKHFFDHPKFGILMQVSRLPEIEEETPIDSQFDEIDQ